MQRVGPDGDSAQNEAHESAMTAKEELAPAINDSSARTMCCRSSGSRFLRRRRCAAASPTRRSMCSPRRRIFGRRLRGETRLAAAGRGPAEARWWILTPPAADGELRMVAPRKATD